MPIAGSSIFICINTNAGWSGYWIHAPGLWDLPFLYSCFPACTAITLWESKKNLDYFISQWPLSHFPWIWRLKNFCARWSCIAIVTRTSVDTFLSFFIYFQLCWAFSAVWSTPCCGVRVQVSHCDGFPCCGSRPLGCGLSGCSSWALGHRLSSCCTCTCCSKALEIFPDQGSSLCLLHWQADSLPLSHQGSPVDTLLEECTPSGWLKPPLLSINPASGLLIMVPPPP